MSSTTFMPIILEAVLELLFASVIVNVAEKSPVSSGEPSKYIYLPPSCLSDVPSGFPEMFDMYFPLPPETVIFIEIFLFNTNLPNVFEVL